MWVERDGSPKYDEDAAGARSLTRIFDADLGTGRSQATAAGIIRNTTYVWDGITFRVQHISIENTQGHDQVTVEYTLATNNLVVHSRDPGAAFNDGVVRRAGDQEWTVEFGVDQQPAGRALAFDGSTWNSQEDWGLGDNGQDIPVIQPSIFLIYRLWMYKSPYFPLPITKFHALQAVKSYIPGGTGTYDTGLPRPRIMHVLGRNGIEPQFLCVGITLEADGYLTCRVARYQYLNKSWLTEFPGLFGS